MKYSPYLVPGLAAVCIALGSFRTATAQNTAAISVDRVCDGETSVTLIRGETRTVPEFVFRITASKWATYSLTRTVVVPPDAHFSVSNVRFYISRDATAGNDCTLTNNTVGLGPNSGALTRVDEAFQHTVGNREQLPDETGVWVSVGMDITGTGSGNRTVIIECTVEDYSF